MTFDEYQKAALARAIYPGVGEGNITYPTLGICGEAGEVAEKVKKLFRDEGGDITTEFVHSIAKEMGDVLWYLAALCGELGIHLEDVAQLNIDKTNGRHDRGTLHGDGDNR